MRRLITFGGLTLEHFEGLDSPPKLRSRLAILAVLAASGRRGVRRERMTALFWPDSDDERARNALRQSLFALRRELQVDDLTVGNNDLRLNSSVITSDIEEFEAAIRDGRLEAAITIYRGPFLNGVVIRDAGEFEHWVDEQRARLAGDFAQALESLATEAARTGDTAAAAEWWRRRAITDPFSSRVARHYMEALNRAGDPERAIGYSAEHAAVVLGQLGVPADVEVQRLATRIADELRGKSEKSPIQQPAIQQTYAAPQWVALPLGSPRRRRALGWIVVGLFITMLGWQVAWPKARDESGVVRFALAFPADAPFENGVGATFAVSPNGKMLVYRGLDGTTTRLFVRTFDQMAARALDGSDGADQPRFSPDGAWIAFIANGELRKIPVAGGRPTTLATLPQVFGLSWGNQEEIVASSRGVLVAVAEAGGPPRVIAMPDSSRGELAKRWPIVLEDGNTIVFSSWRAVADSTRIGMTTSRSTVSEYLNLPGAGPVAVLDGMLVYAGTNNNVLAVKLDARRQAVVGSPQQVMAGVEVGGSGGAKAATSKSGTLVYLSLANSQLTVVDSAGTRRPLSHAHGRYSYPRYSPNGQYVALTVTSSNATDIWVLDVARGTMVKLTDDGVSDRAEWSPDGRKVMFHSQRSAQPGLYWRDADAKRLAEPLVINRNEVYEGVISPDAQAIIYRTSYQGLTGDSIWSVDRKRAGTAKPEFIAAGRLPRLSPDGRWLAYESRSSGVAEVYLLKFPNGVPVRVSETEGHQPVWSHDGSRLYFGSGGQLLSARLLGDGSGRIMSRDTVLRSGIILISGVHAVYDVTSRDGEFLFSESPNGGSLLVVRGWQSELRRIGSGQ